jgi:hypothetical protein
LYWGQVKEVVVDFVGYVESRGSRILGYNGRYEQGWTKVELMLDVDGVLVFGVDP